MCLNLNSEIAPRGDEYFFWNLNIKVQKMMGALGYELFVGLAN